MDNATDHIDYATTIQPKVGINQGSIIVPNCVSGYKKIILLMGSGDGAIENITIE